MKDRTIDAILYAIITLAGLLVLASIVALIMGV